MGCAPRNPAPRNHFWCGSSEHQAATVQLHSVEEISQECRPLLGALPLSLTWKNHRGFSVAFSNGCSVAVPNGMSFVSGICQRIVTCPVDFYWNCPTKIQWHFSTDFHVCEIWCNSTNSHDYYYYC